MIAYILRRLLQLLPVLLIASTGIWAMIYAVPGSPVAAMVGENATPEQIQAVTVRLGLDRPVHVQYAAWLGSALQGDFGLSIQNREPVLNLIGQRIPATLQLGLAATLVGLLLGIPVAVLSALKPGSLLDRSLSAWSALALGVPTFWLGILLILLFAVQLRWLPSASAYVSVFESPWDAIRNLLLPALTLGVYVSGIFARFLRASLLGELKADYVRTARAKGLSEPRVMFVHVLRNALIPVITFVISNLPGLLLGAFLLERFFGIPGVGREIILAVERSDFPVIKAVTVYVAIATMIFNLIGDVLYRITDPRVQLR